MRTAGWVMTIMGLIALAFTVIGVFTTNKGGGDGPLFFGDSWFPIMFIFWFGAGISLLLSFPANEKEDRRRRPL